MAETASRSNSLGLTVHAIIPSSIHGHVLVREGFLPNKLHQPSQGTYEDTLGSIGRDNVGVFVYAAQALFAGGGNLYYVTQPVNPDRLTLAEGCDWNQAIAVPGLEQLAETLHTVRELLQ